MARRKTSFSSTPTYLSSSETVRVVHHNRAARFVQTVWGLVEPTPVHVVWAVGWKPGLDGSRT
jgi:hypothetical protein